LKIVVIGTGLSALSAILGIQSLNKNVEIMVIEAGNTEVEKSKEFEKRTILETKSRKNNKSYKTNEDDIPSNLIIGGWSNYWGATFLPWEKKTLESIFGKISFDKYYEIIGKFVGYQASIDKLAEDYPIYGQFYESGEISDIARHLLQKQEKINSFQHSDFMIGRSRLAINKLSLNPKNGCNQCGKCLIGCGYGHIFNSYKNLLTLKQITIVTNTKVEKIIDGEKVSLVVKRNDGFEYVIDSINLLIIASGPINTGKIILNSDNFEKLFTKETPMLIIPSIYFGIKRMKETSENQITLSELFIQEKNDKGALNSAGQAYSLNRQLQQLAKKYEILKILPKFIKSRILIIMYFVRSSEESLIEISDSLEPINKYMNPYTKETYIKEYRRIKRFLRKYSVITFFFKNLIQPRGKSYHYAGLYTVSGGKLVGIVDIDGKIRIEKYNRVRIVDSSALIEPAPGPISFTVMANSYRITSELDLRDFY